MMVTATHAGADSLSLPERLTQGELAAHWRMSPRSLERWRIEAMGPAWIRLAGRVLYRRSDVLAYEETHLCGPSRKGGRP